jgi:hypothetical protein
VSHTGPRCWRDHRPSRTHSSVAANLAFGRRRRGVPRPRRNRAARRMAASATVYITCSVWPRSQAIAGTNAFGLVLPSIWFPRLTSETLSASVITISDLSGYSASASEDMERFAGYM